jgi:hypothetical protein
MAQFDKIHDAVKNALIKDGWTITADPYRIEFEEYRLFADMAAERPIAATKDNKILLEKTEPETKLYLAISEATYSDFFVFEATQFIIRTEKVSLFTVNLENEVIERWINH